MVYQNKKGFMNYSEHHPGTYLTRIVKVSRYPDASLSIKTTYVHISKLSIRMKKFHHCLDSHRSARRFCLIPFFQIGLHRNLLRLY